MLAIRMQRTGRSGHAQFRVIVQDSRFSPTSGRVVEYLGSYDPHTKVASIDKDKAAGYLKNGAQPSERVVKLLKDEGVKLPGWVEKPAKRKGEIRNPEKLRRNRPEEPEAPAPSAEPVAEADAQAAEAENEAPAEPEAETPVEATSAEAETAAEETPAEPEAPATEDAPEQPAE
jgi:small subunit ribosomal protein S16